MSHKTDFICDRCREADRTRTTHPGVLHPAGICDCACRDKDVFDPIYSDQEKWR